MESVRATMKIQANKLKSNATGEAINSVAYTTAAQGSGAVAQLSFKEYLRFVDMGVGRGHPLGGTSSMQITLMAHKKTGAARKPKKVYSKPAWSKITYLQNQLLYGFSEEAIRALKEEINENEKLIR